MIEYTPMTDEELQEIERITSGANRGPWRMWGMQVRGPKPGVSENDADVEHSQVIANTWDEERGVRTFNGSFVCMARTQVPRLVAEVRRLRKKLSIKDGVIGKPIPDVPGITFVNEPPGTMGLITCTRCGRRDGTLMNIPGKTPGWVCYHDCPAATGTGASGA